MSISSSAAVSGARNLDENRYHKKMMSSVNNSKKKDRNSMNQTGTTLVFQSVNQISSNPHAAAQSTSTGKSNFINLLPSSSAMSQANANHIGNIGGNLYEDEDILRLHE